jgi:hypothetical protein
VVSSISVALLQTLNNVFKIVQKHDLVYVVEKERKRPSSVCPFYIRGDEGPVTRRGEEPRFAGGVAQVAE